MTKKGFDLQAPYEPTWDQPEAIDAIYASIRAGSRYQTLQWVTGSGKTFTMANIIQKAQRPTLVIAHNKTLAAQLAQEFAEFFPNNAVHYFVSYYDYYQPEAYIQKTDTYIEKDSSINEEIDRLRHAATESLVTRDDVIIVASVSCIYGIGNKEQYAAGVLTIRVGEDYIMDNILDKLVGLQFQRAGEDFKPKMFQLLGDTLEIFPASQQFVYTLEFFWDHLEKITRRDPLTGTVYEVMEEITIFPSTHTVTSPEHIQQVAPLIQKELEERVEFYKQEGNLVAAERIRAKTEYDLEMMQEVGYVKGVENYSRYLDGRKKGEPPMTLIDFFPDNFLCFIDESHITLTQIQWMFAGDKSRKDMLIEHGFRLPSAYDNRPLYFGEFEEKIPQFVCVSATPSDSHIEQGWPIIEQVIRPTGLLDPVIEVEDMEYVVDSIMDNVDREVKKWFRCLITTVTKKSSEDLAGFLANHGVKTAYLHSDIDTVERLEILRDLRMGTIDVLVWVNLLREGLDLPEVSFIGIMDAHKQGFLRSTRSLIQIVGRAARNAQGRVIMYAYQRQVSPAMQETIDITNRRRKIQDEYNKKHNIIPKTVISSIKDVGVKSKKAPKIDLPEEMPLQTKIKKLELEMDVASANLDFEKAADLRDALLELKWDKR